MSAKVWLVGAGPGDPELLTLKALRALNSADVVMIDDLVNPAVLEHCVNAKVISVGKRGGCRSTPQEFIHRLMLRYARQGKCVVRLKGGDPCIFGRGSEEAEWLGAHGIEVELVNGITAGLAGATQCGIPLTLRGVARGVTLVTAHTQDDSSLNWQALAQTGTTLVVYMGVAKLEEVQRELMAGGLAASTPVAMIENASLPHQRECRSDLATMSDAAQVFRLKSPAVIVIGEVSGLGHVTRACQETRDRGLAGGG
ncbi:MULTISPECIES: uroporphyrinogen-III C-methyltransferase [Pseudomonas]|jgi:uroporphyrin-III C-methyltransferase|uniref:uroporphyrinogen-III C-methyltransferase n=1 Tax=Pseudomonas spirodelae TaxID=3101751 RepID=A0ABU5P843_9PSED|nr:MULTISPECIES: uroporphyrinogen-III C-methyltransferase [unclassified Pseudomonas]MBU0808352.1 uroporphyrinogen-III C-methyltransferase [Gammaproteobacteria bacterium]MBU0885037.1 uroporphyrinogen-III C-methyltransferase [Gammaproteobacteria bacterium]MBU1859075.1 uroporphyrinogen-III C-methyltransferase [Gammaproteobacteria bacterium]MDD2161154.1 uroporphyrinogen-III C-methyltransferase [Pseudomonas sp. MIL19]MEA1605837.1 uroporphyrinogen-III C-methyltransferase [Pseudomonas sp. T5W1]